MSRPTIHGIRFSEDDIRFMDDQAQKQNMLQCFICLLALEKVLDLSTRATKITRLADFLQPIEATAIDVLTPSWQDASEGLLQIEFNMAVLDTNLHLQGKYMSYGEKFTAPKGKAKQFFIALASFYSELSGKL